MSKRLLTWGFIALAGISLIMGYSYNSHLWHNQLQKPAKTAARVQKIDEVVKTDTRIIMEKEYRKCGHVIVSGYNEREGIVGLNKRGLSQYFKKDDGYVISFADNLLIIHQSIDDDCPEDREQYSIKEYRGRIAVYTGDEENEILLRVTAIRLEMLPENIQKEIRTGQYRFQDEASLNDTLENFDEYL